jgi:hypothetical protein
MWQRGRWTRARDEFTPSIEMFDEQRQIGSHPDGGSAEVLAEIPFDRCGPSFPTVDYFVRRRALE